MVHHYNLLHGRMNEMLRTVGVLEVQKVIIILIHLVNLSISSIGWSKDSSQKVIPAFKSDCVMYL